MVERSGNTPWRNRPGGRAISPSPVFVSSSPALTPVPVNPGPVTANATLATLSDSLISLQTNLEQTLPVLILFNNNFDFFNISGNANQTAPPAGNFSANLGTNFASNFAVNAAVPTGGSLFNTAANVRTTAPAAAGLTQGFAALPVSRDTLRALLVLQSDVERMLPLLNALNGGATNAPGSFTNLFGVVPASP